MKSKRLIAFGLALTLVLAGCGGKKEEPVSSAPAPVESAAEEVPSVIEESDVPEGELLPEAVEEEPVAVQDDYVEKDEAPEGQMKSYLTGEYVDTEIGTKRPVAIMFNNIQAACPQTSISQADIVYESPVEGGITRLMGIFENWQDLDKIGSVRSCRIYYLRFALGYDAIYCCFGHSKYAEDLLNDENSDTMDGVNGTGSGVYFRSSDRKAPHNAYASADGINKGIERHGFRTEYKEGFNGYFKWANVGDTISYEGSPATHIETGYYHNYPTFEYDSESGLYKRTQFGKKHIDDLNNKQLAFKNIILQFCDHEMYGDGKSLRINLKSGGKAMYICNGVATELTWTRDWDANHTHYWLPDGKELRMNTGKTFVGVILNSNADRLVIE